MNWRKPNALGASNGMLERKFRPLFVLQKNRYHPLASDWAQRVLANGGAAMSAVTVRAVSDFCRELDAQGARDHCRWFSHGR